MFNKKNIYRIIFDIGLYLTIEWCLTIDKIIPDKEIIPDKKNIPDKENYLIKNKIQKYLSHN